MIKAFYFAAKLTFYLDRNKDLMQKNMSFFLCHLVIYLLLAHILNNNWRKIYIFVTK